MNSVRTRQSPEAIEAEITAYLDHLRRAGLGASNGSQAHGLKLLRTVCRAYLHGHLPPSLISRYEGTLRNLRPHILRLQRTGRYITPAIVTELERAWTKRPHRTKHLSEEKPEAHMSHPLFQLLLKLEAAKIHFTLARHREDTILVTLTMVGERAEIDVFEDGHMEVSRFPGSEDIVGGAELVEKLIAENKD